MFETTDGVALVQLSDPHLMADDPGSADRFRAAIERARAVVPSPLAVIVSGDIAHNGAPDEYATAAELLGAIEAPVIVLPGNKDSRAVMRAAFGLPGDPDDRVQTAETVGPLRIMACDTQVPGELAGDLDMPWLTGQLRADRQTPTVIAMHHPPIELGAPGPDAIGLELTQRAGLAHQLAEAPNVALIVAGHVHRAVSGQVGRVRVATAPSVNFQMALDFSSPALTLAAGEQPGLLVHAFTAHGLATHVVPIV